MLSDLKTRTSCGLTKIYAATSVTRARCFLTQAICPTVHACALCACTFLGKQPVFSGQPAKGTTIETFLTVSVTGSSEKALYSGSGTPGHVDLDACKNGIKDGTESDVDCGGLCSLKCASTKACKLDSDCEHGSCSQDKKCGGFSGLSEKLAGDSCKQIKRDYPKSKNGKYFIKGTRTTNRLYVRVSVRGMCLHPCLSVFQHSMALTL